MISLYAGENRELNVSLGPVPRPTANLFGMVYKGPQDPILPPVGLVGALVELFGTSSSLYQVRTTDENGHFTFEDISTGDYLIVYSCPGYQTEEHPITLVEGWNQAPRMLYPIT